MSRAVVLAAGRGTRLRPLTDSVPKPMVPVGGRPVLEHVLHLLVHHGFREVAINVHHLPEAIWSHVGDGSQWGLRITYSYEPRLLGTAGAVRALAAWAAAAPFLVYYGDNLTNFDLTDLWSAHRAAGAVATIGLIEQDEPTTRGIVGLDADGRITRMVEKPRPEQVFTGYLVNAGVYVLEPEILAHIPSTPAPDFARDVFPRLLAAGIALRGHRMRGQLLSTDTHARLAAAEASLAAGRFALP